MRDIGKLILESQFFVLRTLAMLWLFKINFRGFRRFLININDNLSYVVLYTQCLRYNICSAWFLDIRISTCIEILVVIVNRCGVVIDTRRTQ